MFAEGGREVSKSQPGVSSEGDDGGVILHTARVPVCGPHVGGNEERVQCLNGGRRWRLEHGGGIRAVKGPQCG